MYKSIFQTEVTFLQNVRSTIGRKKTLANLLLSDEWRAAVEAVRAERNPDKQKALKKELPCFTASGLFHFPVCANNLTAHSGYLCIDIDQQDNAAVDNFAQLKKEIHKIPYIAYCGLSCRGHGFFCLIPIKDPAKHGQYFKALQKDFKACGLIIDPTCRDVCRKRFVSYDPDPYINTAALVYDNVIEEQQRVENIYARKTDKEKKHDVEKLLCTIKDQEADITPTYEAWFECLCALAKEFGEAGRDYAHSVSMNYSGYSHEETDAKYDDILRHNGYGYNIGSLFYHAQQVLKSAAYDFKDIDRDFDPDDCDL